MKTPLSAIAIFISASASAFCEKVTFISNVDGVRYESTVDTEAIRNAGEFVAYRIGSTNFISEPLGIPLPEALAKAEAEARRILGKGYTGEDPRWLLKSAKREEGEGESGYYYHFSYSTREGGYSRPEGGGPPGNLQIVVLLDGTVLKTERVQPKE
jgi:hypothetical protein